MKMEMARIFRRAIAITGATALVLGVGPVLAWSSDSEDGGDQAVATAKTDAATSKATSEAKAAKAAKAKAAKAKAAKAEAKAEAKAKAEAQAAAEAKADADAKAAETKVAAEDKAAADAKAGADAQAGSAKEATRPAAEQPAATDRGAQDKAKGPKNTGKAGQAADDKATDDKAAKDQESQGKDSHAKAEREKDKPREVTPLEPAFINAATHDAKATIVIPAVACVSYWLGGDQLSAGNNAVANSGTVKVQAKAGEGCKLAAGAKHVWFNTFKAPKAPEPTDASATTPADEENQPSDGASATPDPVDPAATPDEPATDPSAGPGTEPSQDPEAGQEPSADPAPGDQTAGEETAAPSPEPSNTPAVTPVPDPGVSNDAPVPSPTGTAATPSPFASLAKRAFEALGQSAILPDAGVFAPMGAGPVVTCEGPEYTNKDYTVEFTATQTTAPITSVYFNPNMTGVTGFHQGGLSIASYSRSFPISTAGITEGRFQHQCSANDGTNITDYAKVLVDKIDPTVAVNVNLSPGSGTWYNGSGSISATATDPGSYPSGISGIHAELSSTGFSTSFDQPGASLTWAPTGLPDGTYTLTVQATDKAGNVSGIVSKTLDVDVTPPAISIDGPANGAIVTPRTDLKITATDDASGLMEYSVTASCNGTSVKGFPMGGTQEANGAVIFSGPWPDGTCQVSLEARDNAGNDAVPVKISFTVDATAPIFDCTATPSVLSSGSVEVRMSNITEVSRASYNLRVTGPGGGGTVVTSLSDYRHLTLDKSDLVKTATYESLELGTYTLQCSGRDEFGNPSIKSTLFTVADLTKPTITPALTGDVTTCGESLDVGMSAEDDRALERMYVAVYDVSDPSTALYSKSVNTTATNDSFSGTFDFTKAGTYKVVYEAIDKAGNKADQVKVTVTVSPDQCTWPEPEVRSQCDANGRPFVAVFVENGTPAFTGTASTSFASQTKDVPANGRAYYNLTQTDGSAKIPAGNVTYEMTRSLIPSDKTVELPYDAVNCGFPEPADVTGVTTMCTADNTVAVEITVNNPTPAITNARAYIDAFSAGSAASYPVAAGAVAHFTVDTGESEIPDGTARLAFYRTGSPTTYGTFNVSYQGKNCAVPPPVAAPVLSVTDPSELPCFATEVSPTVIGTGAQGYAKVALFKVPEGASGDTSKYAQFMGAASVASDGTVTWKPVGLTPGSIHTWAAVGILADGTPDLDRASQPARFTMARAKTGPECETPSTPVPAPSETVPVTPAPSGTLPGTDPTGTPAPEPTGVLPGTDESASPAPTPTASADYASDTATPAPSTSAAAAADGTLPYTGFDSGMIAVIAVLAIGLGTLFLIAARRRREDEEAS